MVFKIIDVREKRTMSKSQEDAVIREFERFQPEGSTHLKTLQKEHLDTEFQDYACCDHAWQPIPPDPEGTKFLQKVFEETDLGSSQRICAICGALSLWENGRLFAYDAVANAEKPERQERPARKERR